MRLKERILVLLICAMCCVLCVFLVVTTKMQDVDYYRYVTDRSGTRVNSHLPYIFCSRSLGFSKLSERAASLPLLTPFQRRFLYKQMSKELEQSQKTTEGQQQSSTPFKVTQKFAKSELISMSCVREKIVSFDRSLQ